MKALPTGTVTFLFTDVEGSTQLVQRLGARHREVLEFHAHLLGKPMAESGGIEVGERGDGYFSVLVGACDATRAPAELQRSLAEHSWPPGGTVRVRAEGLRRQLDSDILVTGEVRSRIGEGFRMSQKPPALIKGKSTPVATWAFRV